jgi:hypothetical protein
MWLKATVIASCLILVSTAAQAQGVDADQFLEAYAADIPHVKQQLARKLHDIEYGLGLANAELAVRRHQEQLYCQPPSLALADEQLVSILRDEVKEVPPTGKMDVGLALLYGLERVFPCNTPQ